MFRWANDMKGRILLQKSDLRYLLIQKIHYDAGMYEEGLEMATRSRRYFTKARAEFQKLQNAAMPPRLTRSQARRLANAGQIGDREDAAAPGREPSPPPPPRERSPLRYQEPPSP